MPFVECFGVTFHYSVQAPVGRAGHAQVWLVLIHALGTDSRVWEGCHSHWTGALSVLTLDLPGHGLSGVARHPLELEELAQAVTAVMDEVGIERAVIGGLSAGGLVAQACALQAPERVLGLCLAATGARIGDAEQWAQRRALVEQHGLAAVKPSARERWFSPRFRSLAASAVEGYLAWLDRTQVEGYLHLLDLLARTDLTQEAAQIAVPTLVIAAADDSATSATVTKSLADAVSGCRYATVASAGHLVSLEQPAAFATEVMAFCREVGSRVLAPADARSVGERMRRAVLGDGHVDRALAEQTSVDAEFQDYITRCVWGEVWARPGLDRPTKHLVTLAILAALGRHEELALHLRAIRNTGVGELEVIEAFLHVAVYAGVPAANSAIRAAKQIWAEPR